MTSSRAVPFLDLAAMHAEVASALDTAWTNIVRTGVFVGGEHVGVFEAAFAAYCGTRHCVGVASGTDALELILAALGIGRGDEVILPANTFVATAAAVVTVGATPVFVDVDADTLLVTSSHIETAIGPRTAAVIAVHLYGQMPDMDAIAQTARKAGLALVEDAAQAHGACWDARRAGSYGDAAAFSFYPGKNLGAFGDAGAVTTDDDRIASRVRSLGDHGRAPHCRHTHELPGRNSRMDTLQAAVLLAKLPQLDRWNAQRRDAAERYRAAFAGTECRTLAQADAASSAHHLQVVRVGARDEVIERLTAEDIGWGLHYPVACHRQPAFARFVREPLPVAEEAAEQVVSLPMFPTITDDQIEHVAAAVLASTRARCDVAAN